jgi:hypothetical protein
MVEKNYTLDDCAAYDYPAAIDKVLDVTNKVRACTFNRRLKIDVYSRPLTVSDKLQIVFEDNFFEFSAGA